jgi:S-adenosylmethionine hydrolase
MGTIITLCTDFGTRDGYVGAMKGVLLSIAPQATLVDIAHDIPRQSVAEGAFTLATACGYFPEGTIHLVVVDPGVGSARRPVAVRTRRHFFVAPDNGVLTYALRDQEPLEIVHLTRREYWRSEISHTFHGRDIFSPVAAHLANGVPLEELGEPTQDMVQLPLPAPVQTDDGAIRGHVIHVDTFGNLITDIPAQMLAHRQASRVIVGQAHIREIATTYAAVEPGHLLALIGSHGYLEVAVREGSAAQVAAAGVGAPVIVE